MLACSSHPLSFFKTPVKVLRKNGVKLITNCESDTCAHEFVHKLVITIWEKLAVVLASSMAFSVLSDGSQARKTSLEKELILIRLVNECGVPCYYIISLEDHVDTYGDVTADNLKLCVDNSLHNKMSLNQEKVPRLLLSGTADGAADNTDSYRGLFTQLKQEGR